MRPRVYSYLRFSNLDQEKGDSTRRQTVFAEEYAEKHGLPLDNTLRYEDRGLSAFHGDHLTKGVFGQFLRLVNQGKVAPGSVLIVESFDRMSREELDKSLELFLAITGAGIKLIVSRNGGHSEYTRESIRTNPTDLMMVVVEGWRAHEESRWKSERLSAAWKGKRKNINERKLTKKCPAWLEPTVERIDEKRHIVKGYTPVEKGVKVIKQIFEMKLAGKGPELIAKELNQSNCWNPKPRKNSKGGWRKSYINKILRTRAVLGEFQPYTSIRKDGKRTREPVGDPIPDYYPEIIAPELFYQVQEQLAQNDYKGGRTGKVTNLFTHRIKCGYCGSAMVIENKGTRGGKRLVCDYANRKLGCVRFALPYPYVEKCILRHIKGLRAEDLFPDQEQQQSEISSLQGQLAAVKGELERVQGSITNVKAFVYEANDERARKDLESDLVKLYDKRDSLKKDKDALERRIDELSKATETAKQRLDDIEDLFLALEHSDQSNKIELRLKLREQLKGILEQVTIYPRQLEDIELVYKVANRSILLGHDRVERYRRYVRDKL